VETTKALKEDDELDETSMVEKVEAL